jgi:hypothetical protein
MAQSAIIENLNRELQKPVRAERQVVYILAEIRKFIEHARRANNNSYRLLAFFCNWALHTEMFQDKINILKLLEQFDVAEGVSYDDFLISKFNLELKEMGLLRAELTAFLAEHILPNTLVSSNEEWQKFLFLYMLVIADVRLRYTEQLPGHYPFEALVQELQITYEPDKHSRGSFVWEALTSGGSTYRHVIRYGHRDDDYEVNDEIPGFFESLEF